MRFIIATIALLVLGSIVGSVAGFIFWPDLAHSSANWHRPHH